jgi:phosphoglycolate phosphatase
VVKRKKLIRYIIFDFDGTLLNSFDKVLKALKLVKKKNKIKKLRTNQLKKYFSIGGVKLISKVFSIKKKEIARQLLIDFRSSYLKLKSLEKYLTYDIFSTLELLKSKKIKTILCSNKPRNLCITELNELRLIKYFNFIICSDDIGVKKPDIRFLKKISLKFKIKKKNCIYVGDGYEDYLLSKNYNLRFLLIKNQFNSVICKKLSGKKNVINIKRLSDIFNYL